MIIYGSRGKHILSEYTDEVECSHCKQKTKHTVSIFGRYAHVYWIPFFPIGKKGVSECSHCKITLEPKEMNESLKLAFENINSKAKSPIWFWSGLAIIGLLFISTLFR